MPKNFKKYFVAITPTGEIQERATDVKLQLKEKFNLKYALKSPAHVTLKMPFLWKEHRENILVSRFSAFFQDNTGFNLKLGGIGKFGSRVLFIKVEKHEALMELQKKLAFLCKTHCNMKLELSDYAYHPHMTVAFKDLKNRLFEEYLMYLRSRRFYQLMEVDEVALLKKEERTWVVCHRFPLRIPQIEV